MGANLFMARLERTSFRRAQMQGANLRSSRMTGARLEAVQLQDADFGMATMHRTYINSVELDSSTIFGSTDFQGAAMRNVDLSEVVITLEQLHEIFGDRTVLGMKFERLPRWYSNSFKDQRDFAKAWRTWQRDMGFDPDDPSTWDD